MRIGNNWLAVCLVLLLGGLTVVAGQGSKWLLTVGGGRTFLPMTSLNNKHKAEVDGWASVGVPLGDFPKLGETGMYVMRVQYRFRHNGALSLTISGLSHKVGTSSLDPDIMFVTTRTVELEDYAVGIIQFLPELIYPLEIYFELAVGSSQAKFSAVKVMEAAGVQLFDEVASFAADKGYGAVALGAYLPLWGPLVVNGEARFKSIPIGPMDGTRVEFGVERPDRTGSRFDFSGVYLSLELGVAF